MIRYLLALLVFIGFATSLVSQAEQRIDHEYISTCLVDSLPSGEVVRFTRLLQIGTARTIDVDILGNAYTPTGTVLTCGAYDLDRLTFDPVTDLYDNCQCVYTITQENHFVPEILGEADQQYVVEFQEFVRRQCSGQQNQYIVHQDTLRDTFNIDPGFNLSTGFPFDAPGQIVNAINIRVYAAVGFTTTVTVDLNPATVQTSYPALTLDPADFTFDGTNKVAVAAAYELVINHAVELINGVPVNPVEVFPGVVTDQVTFRHRLFHQPNYPYVILPRPDDTDYLVLSTIPNNPVTLAQGAVSAITRTSDYSEECTPIFTEQSAIYLTWDRLSPLSMLPIPGAEQTFRPNSTPSAFCSTDPAVCAELSSQEVILGECVEICSEIEDIVGHRQVISESYTLAAGTYNSVSVFVDSGPVEITMDGTTISYATNRSFSFGASARKTIKNDIIINASGSAEATITYVR